jgi:uncharacterized membrane protein
MSLEQLRLQDLTLSQPVWLWLLALIPLFLLIQRFTLVNLSKGQQRLSVLFRLLILALLAVAMSGLSSRGYRQQMALVIAVDVSPSVPDAALKEAQETINQLWKSRKKNDIIRVLTFANSSRLRSSKAGLAPKITRHKKELASNLQAAIRHAYSLLPADYLHRLLLFSDGRETKGSALEEVLNAKRRGIRVFTQVSKAKYPPEVFIQNLRFPSIVRLNSPFYVNVDVFSTYKAKKVLLTLYKNGFLLAYRRVDLVKGSQSFQFRAQVDEPGVTSIQAVIKPGLDRFKGNNRFVRAIPIRGKPRVLYLEGNRRAAKYLSRALRKQRFLVDVRSGYGIPNKISDLRRYDLVMISDIPAYQMSARQMRLFDTYVRNLGGGLIMVGGENSFGPGGYFQTRMERLLPVRFDKKKRKDTPSLALVMVIDKSGSMSGNRIALARQAAKTTVQLLGPSDRVGVVAFDSTPTEVVSLQTTRNKGQIMYQISRIHASGGTRILSALQMAYRMLSGVRAKVKHVILLSDGQDSKRGIRSVLQSMTGERITVSSIAVGSGSDRSLLRMIAQGGGGRFYYTEDPYNIPKIFTKETSKVSKNSLIEEPFRPRVKSYSQAIKGMRFSAVPYILGYVSVKAKRNSQVILSTDTNEPLLVSWRRGLGRVMAYTSDVKNRWAAQWIRRPSFERFWAQVIRTCMRQGPSRQLKVKAIIEEGIGKITVDAISGQGDFLDHLIPKGIILDPALRRTNTSLFQTGPGFYQGRFVPKRHGAYLVKVRFNTKKGRFVGMGQTSVSYSYPAELLSASPDLQRMKTLATLGKGALNPTNTDLWKRNPKERLLVIEPLWPWLIALVLILFLLDVFLRRVRIFGRAAQLSSSLHQGS